MKKRLLSALLLIATLALTACASDTSGSTSDTSAPSSDAASDTTAAAETEYIDTLPRENLDGYNFRIIAQSYDQRPNLRLFEEENGDVINDAIIARDRAVEDRLNLKIVGYSYEDREEIRSIVKNVVLANEDAYDLIITSINFGINTLTTDGCLYELSSMKYLDLESEWWLGSIYRDFSVDGKVYFTSGPLSTMMFYISSAVAYNKTLTEKYGISGLEQLVHDGEWTFDKMVSLAKNNSADLNGDGVMDGNDQYGIVGAYTDCYLLLGMGEKTINRTGDASFELNMDNPRFIERLEKNAALFADKSTLYGMNDTTIFLAMFQADQAMFMPTSMNNVIVGYQTTPSCREMESDYGILPIPMFDENQGEYICVGQPASPSGIAVPATCKDSDRTSLVMATMAYYSDEHIRPAAYDSTVKGKASRQPETEAMLDIIYSAVFFDQNYVFNFGDTMTVVRNAIKDGTGSYVSNYEAKREVAIKALDDYTKLMTELD